MAKDGFSLLVNMIEEENEFPEVKIWVIVPGGLLFGTLVSEQRFAAYGHEHDGEQSIPLEEGILRAEMQLFATEMAEKYEAHFSNSEHVEACLIDVQIISGGAMLRPQRVRVRIADVSAWGLGSVPLGFLRSTPNPVESS